MLSPLACASAHGLRLRSRLAPFVLDLRLRSRFASFFALSLRFRYCWPSISASVCPTSSMPYHCAFIREGEHISVRQVDDKKEKGGVQGGAPVPGGRKFLCLLVSLNLWSFAFICRPWLLSLSTCGRSPLFVALGLQLRLSTLSAHCFAHRFSRVSGLWFLSAFCHIASLGPNPACALGLLTC